MKRIPALAVAVLLVAALAGCRSEEVLGAKPVIYLYPEEEMEISVSLAYDGRLTVTYPDYRDGWQVRALPDGTLFDLADGREYSYLF